MGDPKKLKKKYSRPSHPWQKARIDEEKILTEEFGFKNKKEIWKLSSLLTNYGEQAKKLTTLKTKQAGVEKKQLLDRLHDLGLLNKGAQLEDVLTLTLRNIIERRLQTQILKQGLARTINQSRQFITHGHVAVNSKVITSPSYLVTIAEESKLSFVASSSLSSNDHPERVVIKSKGKSKKVHRKDEQRK